MKFDAFSVCDSDALLSTSYAEYPEKKYRFFRPQGVILDCDTKFVHGGGATDSGSGYKKTIDDFKQHLILMGKNTGQRIYISNLIKKTLDLSDEEYVNFVKNNENKSFTEIEPESSREKLIKAFSLINSHRRASNREYNEFLISNPKPPMAVFAYEMDCNKKIRNPIKFLNCKRADEYDVQFLTSKKINPYERTQFLQDYAIKNDIPFVIFGD